MPKISTLRRPSDVRGAARQEHAAAERQQVGVDDPGQVGLREAEVLLDGRQRHVHDRGVEHDHERGEADHAQGEPAAVAFEELASGQPCQMRRLVTCFFIGRESADFRRLEKLLRTS